ncbi:MAG: DUF4875 domain-containing protein [Elainellaceae cyanobacterium]
MKKWLLIVPILIALIFIPAVIVNHINGGNRGTTEGNKTQLDPEILGADLFGQAVNSAMAAAEATQGAQSTEDWKNVAQLWQQAIKLLNQVPVGVEVHNVAQKKIGEYQVNLEYAQRNAGIEPVAYTIVDRENDPLPNRRRISISIVAPEALTFEQRAQTVMKAAQELQDSENAHVVTVFLVPSPKLVGMGLPLAIARYAPDSGGYSGDQGWQWEVQATDQPVDEQRLRITELWEEKKSSFLIPDGYGGMMPLIRLSLQS